MNCKVNNDTKERTSTFCVLGYPNKFCMPENICVSTDWSLHATVFCSGLTEVLLSGISGCLNVLFSFSFSIHPAIICNFSTFRYFWLFECVVCFLFSIHPAIICNFSTFRYFWLFECVVVFLFSIHLANHL